MMEQLQRKLRGNQATRDGTETEVIHDTDVALTSTIHTV